MGGKITADVKETGYENVHWEHLAQGKLKWPVVENT
jgi:hypothetical protein